MMRTVSRRKLLAFRSLYCASTAEQKEHRSSEGNSSLDLNQRAFHITNKDSEVRETPWYILRQ